MPKNEHNEQPSLAEYEQRIRERLVIDETSPSGLRWNQFAAAQARGLPAGRMDKYGYWKVNLRVGGKQKTFRAHRMVWFLSDGKWPSAEIDHINGDKKDNRIVNLREASRSENAQNQAMRSSNTSGMKGVDFDRVKGKWRARIRFSGRHILLGRFTNIADAERAVMIARDRLHGEFANHGIHRKAAA